MPAGNSPEGHDSDGLPETTDSVATPERPGALVGRYKLRELIGEGGMGTVWIAEQTEPVRRKVALKLIKPGMDTKEVLSRFQVERQALALMDHPNIAKVHDGGVTGAGRPYFVMEYVKGIPITQYCDEARLTVKQRLELFVDVCQAVQHAHQKGIIHRDLKPSNILVCLYDGKPIPKIIDFGLAKAIHQPLTENTLYTAHGLMVGTPQYMSPEQAEFNNLDVDTRTDVYSLGVVLYELLTGTTPLERKRVKEAAVHEILRLIKEEDPLKPSTKISGSQALPHIAAQRNLEPAQLSRLVRGDLDWIAMKSLEKDRSRRYETASGLARDVQRYLSDEPVEACPPSLGYKLRKLARRNKRALISAALLCVVVLGALTVVAGSIGWVVRDRQNRQGIVVRQIRSALDEVAVAAKNDREDDAEMALKQAQGLAASSELPADLLDDLHSWQADVKMLRQLRAAQLLRTGDVNDRLGKAAVAAAYRGAFTDYQIDLDQITAAAASERIRLSTIQHQLISALDDWLLLTNAGAEQETFRKLRSILAQADDDPWRARFRTAMESVQLPPLLQLGKGGEWERQPPLILAVLAERLLHTEDPDSVYWVLGDKLLNHALARHPHDFVAHLTLGWGTIERAPSEAMRHLEECRIRTPKNPGVHTALALAHFSYDDDATQAESLARDAIQLRDNFAGAHHALGQVLLYEGRADECIVEYRKAVRLDPTLQEACFDLATLMVNQKKAADAEKIFREAIHDEPNSAAAYASLGGALLQEEKWSDAEQAFRDAISLNPSLAPRCSLAQVLSRQGKLAEAERAYRDVIRLAPKDISVLSQFSDFLQSQSRWEEALEMVEEALKIDPQNPNLLISKDILLLTQQLKASPDDAELLARRGLDRLRNGDSQQAIADLMHAADLPEGATFFASEKNSRIHSGQRWLAVGKELLQASANRNQPLAADRSAAGDSSTSQEDAFQLHAVAALRRALAVLEKQQMDTPHEATLLALMAEANVYLGECSRAMKDANHAVMYSDLAYRIDSRTAIDAHRSLGLFLAKQAQWDAAAAHLAIVVENRPQDHLLAMQVAGLQLYRADRSAYDRLCHVMLKRYGAASDPVEADRTAKACLLANPPAGDLATLQRLAEVAVSDSKHDFYRFFVLVRALSAYRSADWQGTVQWCSQGQERIGSQVDVPYLVAHYLVLQAMADQRTGNASPFHSNLAKAAEIIKKEYPDAPHNLGDRWPDWQLYEILRREAEQLVAGAEKESRSAE